MEQQHVVVDGVLINVNPANVTVVASDLRVSDRLWLTQLDWDREAKAFYFAFGVPKIDFGIPGISTEVRLSLGETARRRVVSPRFAYVWASEHGVTVEKVKELSGVPRPEFSPKPEPKPEFGSGEDGLP